VTEKYTQFFLAVNVAMLVMIGVTITFMMAFAVALKIYNLG
jgi:hypothetical protein